VQSPPSTEIIALRPFDDSPAWRSPQVRARIGDNPAWVRPIAAPRVAVVAVREDSELNAEAVVLELASAGTQDVGSPVANADRFFACRGTAGMISRKATQCRGISSVNEASDLDIWRPGQNRGEHE
jgi:hypothetical protein